MIVAIHQPNFLPWLGYFAKLARADTFVLLDTVPFSKGSYTNRVRILRNGEPSWLTVPVVTAGKLGQPIHDVTCSPSTDWRSRIPAVLEAAYAEAAHFQPYAAAISDTLAAPDDGLANLNIRLLEYARAELGIDTPMLRASDLDAQGQATDLLVDICRRLGATRYLSGAGGRGYQDEGQFHANGIEVTYSEFVHPVYPQATDEFQAGLSVVDLLFHTGPEAARVFDGVRSS